MDLKETKQTFEAKRTEYRRLLNLKEPEQNDDTMAQLVTLQGELEGLKADIDKADAREKTFAGLRDAGKAFDDFANTPADTSLPFPTGRDAQLHKELEAHNAVRIMGITGTGYAEFEATAKAFNVDWNGIGYSQGAFKAAATPEYAQVYNKFLRASALMGNMQAGMMRMSPAEVKVLTEGIDTDGGYLSPEELSMQILQKKPTPTRVAGRVNQVPVGRESLRYPKVNYPTDDLYTSGIRSTWAGEVPASAASIASPKPQFGSVLIPVYTVMMSLPLTNDLVEDAFFPLLDWVGGKFAETIDLLKDNMVLTGTGVNQPSGILANPGVTNQPAIINSGSASALTIDGLISLTESLPEQYDDGSAVLVFNKTNTGQAIRKLKDGDGRPIVNYGFQDEGYAGSRFKQVNGYDYLWSGFMPNVGASTYPIIFGDLSGYTMINRIGFSLRVLTEIYAETNQVLLVGRARFGGQVTEDWKLKIQQCHT